MSDTFDGLPRDMTFLGWKMMENMDGSTYRCAVIAYKDPQTREMRISTFYRVNSKWFYNGEEFY